MNSVIDFLKKNGFEKYNKSYINDKCSVNIFKNHYVVMNTNRDEIYSNDLDIYWLIGVLTYYGYIDKNYKQ